MRVPPPPVPVLSATTPTSHMASSGGCRSRTPAWTRTTASGGLPRPWQRHCSAACARTCSKRPSQQQSAATHTATTASTAASWLAARPTSVPCARSCWGPTPGSTTSSSTTSCWTASCARSSRGPSWMQRWRRAGWSGRRPRGRPRQTSASGRARQASRCGCQAKGSWPAQGAREQQLRALGGRGGAAAQPPADITAVEMMMHPMELQPGSKASQLVELPPLPKPYIRVPASILLPVLKTYVQDRIAGKKGEASRMPPLVFECAGQVLSEDSWTVQDVVERVWKPHLRAKGKGGQDKDEVMVVYYAATSG